MSTREEIEKIQGLAESFPSLRGNPYVRAWDPKALDEWAAGLASTGEKLSAQFVLAVWNQFEEWKCGRFDVLDAYARWDEKHWDAFRAWACDPFTL